MPLSQVWGGADEAERWYEYASVQAAVWQTNPRQPTVWHPPTAPYLRHLDGSIAEVVVVCSPYAVFLHTAAGLWHAVKNHSAGIHLAFAADAGWKSIWDSALLLFDSQGAASPLVSV